MCRKSRPLLNFEPPAAEEEIRDAALQFVRKVSGFPRPCKANGAAFNQAVEGVAAVSRTLLEALVTAAKPRERDLDVPKREPRRLGPGSRRKVRAGNEEVPKAAELVGP